MINLFLSPFSYFLFVRTSYARWYILSCSSTTSALRLEISATFTLRSFISLLYALEYASLILFNSQLNLSICGFIALASSIISSDRLYRSTISIASGNLLISTSNSFELRCFLYSVVTKLRLRLRTIKFWLHAFLQFIHDGSVVVSRR